MDVTVLAAPTSWYLRDLQRAAAGRHTVVPASFSEIRASVDEHGAPVGWRQHGVDRAACVLVRTMPPGSLEQVVFRMDALAALEAAGVVVVNHARAIEAAVDKYLALTKLRAAGLLIPATMVCQTVDDALEAFDRLGGDVVVKPLFGGEGRGICRVSDIDLAYRTFKTLANVSAVLYIQQFLEHEGCDWRLFVLGDRVLGMRRSHQLDWRTNIRRGGVGEPIEVDDALADEARRAARSIGAEIAGVDVLPASDGRRYFLEVNAVPGWQALARTLDVDIAARVLDYLESRVQQAADQAGRR